LQPHQESVPPHASRGIKRRCRRRTLQSPLESPFMKLPLTFALALLMTTACTPSADDASATVGETAGAPADATPPVAEQRPYQLTSPPGAVRDDEYYWLRDDSREDADMLAYLNAENAYADEVMASSKPVQEKLYEEIVGRIRQDDSSV